MIIVIHYSDNPKYQNILHSLGNIWISSSPIFCLTDYLLISLAISSRLTLCFICSIGRCVFASHSIYKSTSLWLYAYSRSASKTVATDSINFLVIYRVNRHCFLNTTLNVSMENRGLLSLLRRECTQLARIEKLLRRPSIM